MAFSLWIVCLLVLLPYVLVVVYLSRRERRSKAAAELIHRCEEQHRALLRFDIELGTYGQYPPTDLSESRSYRPTPAPIPYHPK
ncbi:MAG: hypothetical protein ABWY20_21160 [Mycobacterium sp.]